MIEIPRPPSQADIARYRAKGWWKDQTFSQILETRARETADREALSDARRRVSYGALWSEVRRFAEYLRRQGVQRGDVVTLQLPNRIEFPVVFFSLELIGAIANKISADFRATEVEYILRFSKSKAYVCAAQFKGFDYLAMIRELRPGLPELSLVICVDEVEAADVRSFARVVNDTPEIAAHDRVPMSPLDVMRMCFTSGTTGNPKGVLHCFNTTLCTCEIFNRELAVTAGEVMLDYLPVGLNWGYMTLVQAIMAGARVVLMERFSAEAALEAIERERVTYIPTAPASIVAMLNSPAIRERDLSSLRIVITGGASAAVETIKAFQAAIPHAKLIELYGMLETGYHAFTRLTDDPLKVNGTVGRCVDEMGLRMIDDDGNDVRYGEVGEIAAVGPSVHLGYLDNPGANRDSFTADGWFRTGDLGQHADADGNVRIAGRRKEIVNRGGKKYFPREIEELLYQHPKIVQAVIVGAPDPRLGERNCLCAIVKPGTALTLDEVVSFLKGRVADYKLPEELVVMNDFPMTPTGKIRRPELVKRVSNRGEA
ncbi:MAG TPA: AMP-binding protein [Casimicrobiaceae bacterium]|nr:AMP-binding protein [Casimicrobiaceae bacterium]